MTFPIPALPDLRAQAWQAMQARVAGLAPVLRRMVAKSGLSDVNAGMVWLQWRYLRNNSQQLFTWSCTGSYLDQRGSLFGLGRSAATGAADRVAPIPAGPRRREHSAAGPVGTRTSTAARRCDARCSEARNIEVRNIARTINLQQRVAMCNRRWHSPCEMMDCTVRALQPRAGPQGRGRTNRRRRARLLCAAARPSLPRRSPVAPPSPPRRSPDARAAAAAQPIGRACSQVGGVRGTRYPAAAGTGGCQCTSIDAGALACCEPPGPQTLWAAAWTGDERDRTWTGG